MNVTLIIVSVVVLALAVAFIFRKRTDDEAVDELVYKLEEMEGFAINFFDETVFETELTGSSQTYQKREDQREELKAALKSAPVGDRSSKLFVKLNLRDAITKAYDLTDENLEKLIPFTREPRLTTKDKFDILLFHYFKKHRKNAFVEMVKTYKWNELKDLTYIKKYHEDDPDPRGYAVTSEDIDLAYTKEQIELTTDEKIDIVVQRIYERVKGLSVIDEVRDMNIDGIRGGTSGIPQSIAYTIDVEEYDTDTSYIPRSYDSVWIFFKGVSIHMQCLSFGSEKELRRVCQNIYTHDSPGQLDQQTGHKINEMADQSRIVVVGPKFSDSWAFFNRKFDGSMYSLRNLWKDKNAELPIQWIYWSMRGALNTALTGLQGTGKTIAMKASVSNLYNDWTLRIQEGSSFELWIRRAFPNMDVVTFRETAKMSGVAGMVVQKKTDGTVNMVGEVADDQVFANALKAAEVASLFTWYTHHAQSARSLVNAAVTALMNVGVFKDSRLAEAYVVDLMHQNIHLMNVQGTRFCGRVTEYIPTTETIQYDETFMKYMDTDPMKAIAWFCKVKYQEIQKREMPLYTTSDIIKYENGEYMIGARPSDRTLNRIREIIRPEEKEDFEMFIEANWGDAA